MAETIQEFLVSVKYAVDDASQNRFLATLKRISGSVAGVAAEIGALSGSITYLTKTLAETGEKFYLMSNRIGSSVNDIKTATFAMEQFGLSASEAAGGLEAFGSWTRSMGPSAMMYLRSIGVTARDTAGQLRQLGPIIRAMGGTKEFAEGSDAQRMQYAITTQRMAMMGINEQMMRAVGSGQYAQDENRAGVILQAIWGSKTKQGAEAAQRKWAEDAHSFMRIFREMGLIFDGIRARFGASLFEKIGPKLEQFNKFLLDNMPKITKAIDVAAFALSSFMELAQLAGKTFLELPGAIQAMIGAFMSFPLLKTLVTSPLFWLITSLTTLLLLMEDFQTFQRGGGSAVNWNGITQFADKMKDAFGPIGEWLKPIWDVGVEFAHWFDCITGIEGSFGAIAGIIGLILGKMGAAKAAGLIGEFLGVGAKTAAGGAGGSVAGGLLAPVLALTSATIIVTYGAFKLEEWLIKKGIVKPDNFKSEEPGQGGTVMEWWWPLPDRTGSKRKEVPDWVKGIGKWFTGDAGGTKPGDKVAQLEDSDALRLGRGIAQGMNEFAQSMGSSNMFAGPGAPGDADFGVTIDGSGRIHPAGGGWAGAALTGRAGGGGSGPMADDAGAPAGTDVSEIGFTREQYDAFRQALARRESHGNYKADNGLGYFGKYQFGRPEIRATALKLGETPPTIQQFLNDPEMQERFMVAYTIDHHRTLMKNRKYAGSDAAGRGAWLGASHIGGTGGATAYAEGGEVRRDANQTSTADYWQLGRDAVRGAPLGSTPMPGQAAGPQQSGFGQAIQHNNTTVNVAPGPDAAATAQKVAEEQTRLYERQVRQYQGMLA